MSAKILATFSTNKTCINFYKTWVGPHIGLVTLVWKHNRKIFFTWYHGIVQNVVQAKQ
jgi:hypothetical protein